MIEDILEPFPLNFDTLQRIQNRVMIVGRFNRTTKANGQPQVFLFTNRSADHIDKEYLDNFRELVPDAQGQGEQTLTHVASLDFNSFVREVKPTVAERVEKIDGKYTKITQTAPSDPDAEQESAATVGPYNYFVLRASANSKQQAIQGDQPRLTSDVLGTNRSAGESVFIQVRTSLRTFSAFQQKLPQLTELLANTFSHFAGESIAINAGFSGGNHLPGGFSKALVDYLYADDEKLPFDLDSLDISPVEVLTKDGRPATENLWQHLQHGPTKDSWETPARLEFRHIVSGFRDFLLDKKNQSITVTLTDATSMNTLLRRLAPPHLSEDFKQSHDSFNTLRQILRSKVLLSMIVRWVLTGYDELPTVKAVSEDKTVTSAAIRQSIQDAILQPPDQNVPDKWRKNRVPRPIARPSKAERLSFSIQLKANLRSIIDAVLFDSTEMPTSGVMSKELADLAAQLRKDPKTVAALKEITGFGNKDFYDASFDAFNTILADVVCPVLYREPLLTSAELSEELNRTLISTYLEAIYLTKEGEEAFRKVGLENRQALSDHIGSDGSISEKDLASSQVAASFINALTAQSDRVEFMRHFRLVKQIQSVLGEYTTGPRTTADISAVNPSSKDHVSGGAERPGPKELIREIVGVKVNKAMAAASAQTSPTPPPTEQPSGAALPGSLGKGEAVAPPPASNKTNAPASHPLLTKIEDIIGKLPPAVVADSDGNTSVVERVTEEAFSSPESHTFARDLNLLDQARHLIYTRYNEQRDKAAFRNNVERMTLANLLLLFKDDLGLGRSFSNQYALLLDLIVSMNPDAPDLQQFVTSHSLTEYFDNADFQEAGGSGFTRLINILDSQARGSLQNLVSIMSELHGIKYLLGQAAQRPEAEVLIVNSTAKEFLNWITYENLTPDVGSGCMRADFLVQPDQSPKLVLPSLVYFNDLAFESKDKSGTKASKLSFLSKLRLFQMKVGVARIVMPPIALAPELSDWSGTGDELAKEAETLSSPVMVIGPAAPLNPPGDRFPTVMPPGYLFCAHLLGSGKQLFQFAGVLRKSAGRFRVIGSAITSITLREAVWPSMRAEEDNSYCFAGDFYLYLILLLSAGIASSGAAAVNFLDFYKCFYYADSIGFAGFFESGRYLNNMMLGHNMLLLSLANIPVNEPLKELKIAKAAGEIIDSHRDVTLLAKEVAKTSISVSHVSWFNDARKQQGF